MDGKNTRYQERISAVGVDNAMRCLFEKFDSTFEIDVESVKLYTPEPWPKGHVFYMNGMYFNNTTAHDIMTSCL